MLWACRAKVMIGCSEGSAFASSTYSDERRHVAPARLPGRKRCPHPFPRSMRTARWLLSGLNGSDHGLALGGRTSGESVTLGGDERRRPIVGRGRFPPPSGRAPPRSPGRPLDAVLYGKSLKTARRVGKWRPRGQHQSSRSTAKVSPRALPLLGRPSYICSKAVIGGQRVLDRRTSLRGVGGARGRMR